MKTMSCFAKVKWLVVYNFCCCCTFAILTKLSLATALRRSHAKVYKWWWKKHSKHMFVRIIMMMNADRSSSEKCPNKTKTKIKLKLTSSHTYIHTNIHGAGKQENWQSEGPLKIHVLYTLKRLQSVTSDIKAKQSSK